MSSEDIILSVRNISKRYELYGTPQARLKQMLFGRFGKRYFREFWALRNIDFTVKRGECIGVIGRNGAGKSTLLQIITGVLNPTTGSVQKKGRVAALLELGSGFNPDFTGIENVYLNAALLGLSRKETDARLKQILDFADIGDFAYQTVKTYSSGMKLRLAFAVQTAVSPDILIVDEALAVGDMFFQQKCYDTIRSMVANGMTLFLVSHNLNAIRTNCTKAIYLTKGRIKAIGPSAEICDLYLNDISDTASPGKAEPLPKGGARAPAPGKHAPSLYREDPKLTEHCTQVSGTRDVEFTALDFYDSKKRRAFLCRPNEKTTVVVSFRANRDVPAGLAIGLLFRDTINTNLFGLNTNFFDVAIGPLKQGGKYTYSWTFDMPLLPGKYPINIGMKPDPAGELCYHHLMCVNILEVVPEKDKVYNAGRVLVQNLEMKFEEEGSC